MKEETPDLVKSQHADSIVKNHVMMTMGAGVLPFALADILAVSVIQVDMVRQLCEVYDVPFAKNRIKSLIGSITVSTIARSGARSLVKLVPGIGWLIGGATQAVFGGASTYALGKVFKMHLSRGGSLIDFNMAGAQKTYRDLFEKGKTIVPEWKKQGQEVSDNHDNGEENVGVVNIMDQLAQLTDWKDRGLLTEEEFIKMKAKLIRA
jgi:uncharacterized protein (DUF697 family)